MGKIPTWYDRILYDINCMMDCGWYKGKSYDYSRIRESVNNLYRQQLLTGYQHVTLVQKCLILKETINKQFYDDLYGRR